MIKESELDLVLLLLLFGLYFIISFLTSNNVFELIYGIILVFYHVKLKFLQRKQG